MADFSGFTDDAEEMVDVLDGVEEPRRHAVIEARKSGSKGCFDVTIKDWSRLTNHAENSEKIQSCDVPCVSHRWRLIVYPHSNSRYDISAGHLPGDHIGVFIELCGDDDESRLAVDCTIRQLCQNGSAEHHALRMVCVLRAGVSRGWPKFMAHTDFDDASKGFRLDDTVKFQVHIRIRYQIRSHLVDPGLASPALPMEPKSLAHDLLKLWQDQRSSDIALIVDGHRYPAHRAILTARSDVFSAMLEHDKFSEVTVEYARCHAATPSCSGGQVRHRASAFAL